MNSECEEDLLIATFRMHHDSWRILSREAPGKPVRVKVSWRCKLPWKKRAEGCSLQQNLMHVVQHIWMFSTTAADLLRRLLRRLSFVTTSSGALEILVHEHHSVMLRAAV